MKYNKTIAGKFSVEIEELLELVCDNKNSPVGRYIRKAVTKELKADAELLLKELNDYLTKFPDDLEANNERRKLRIKMVNVTGSEISRRKAKKNIIKE